MKIYRQAIALSIVLALFASMAMAGTATPTTQDFIPAALKTQISADASTFERLATEVLAKVSVFDAKVESLRKRGRVTPQESASVQADGNALKNLLNNLKSSLSSIIDKLRGANKFSGDLDTFLANRIRAKKAEAANKLGTLGGARALLNATLSNINAAITEINSVLADPILSPRRASLHDRDFGQLRGYDLVPVAHTTGVTPSAPPVRFAIVVIKCAVLGTRLLIKTIKGTDTDQDADDFKNCDN